MSEQTNQSSLQNFHWLDLVEIASVIGSVGGTVLTLFINQAALSSIPLSICLAVNLFNRNRLLKVQDEGAEVTTLMAKIEENQINLDSAFTKITTVEQSIANLNSSIDKFQQQDKNDGNLEQELQQLTELVKKLEKMQLLNQTQATVVNNSPESLKELADHCQSLGNLSKAMELYSEAIRHNRRDAQAYQQRGKIRSQLQDKQGAIQDFRMAAKLYFEQGDLENYQQAKDLSTNLYGLNNSNQNGVNSQVTVGKIFS